MDLASTGTLALLGLIWSGWLGANALVREIASCHLHHGIDWAAFERALVISPRNSFLSLSHYFVAISIVFDVVIDSPRDMILWPLQHYLFSCFFKHHNLIYNILSWNPNF